MFFYPTRNRSEILRWYRRNFCSFFFFIIKKKDKNFWHVYKQNWLSAKVFLNIFVVTNR